MGTAEKTLKGAESIFILLLVIGLVGLLFLIIYGNLSGNLGWTDVGTTITNESVSLDTTTLVGTIADNTNPNFVSWNASRVINRTINATAEMFSNNTLVEGVDYTIFVGNGSMGNTTVWNASFITYTVNRESQGETDTDNVISNLTTGATQFFTFSNVWFVLTAITVLIGIVLGVIVLVRKTSMGESGRREPQFT